MATIDVKTSVSAPAEIVIPLVRADQYATANIFRIAFEACLSGTSATAGAILTMQQPLIVHWVLLGVFLVFGAGSLGCTIYYSRASKKVPQA